MVEKEWREMEGEGEIFDLNSVNIMMNRACLSHGLKIFSVSKYKN